MNEIKIIEKKTAKSEQSNDKIAKAKQDLNSFSQQKRFNLEFQGKIFA